LCLLYISHSIICLRPGRSRSCRLAENGDLRWPAPWKAIAAFVAETLRGVLLARFGLCTPDAPDTIAWLHRFPVSDAAQLGVTRQNVAELIEEVRADALDAFDVLRAIVPSAPFGPIIFRGRGP